MKRFKPNLESISISIWALKVFLKLAPVATITKIVTGILIEMTAVFGNLIIAYTIDFFVRTLNTKTVVQTDLYTVIALYIGYYIIIMQGVRLLNQYASAKLRRILRFAPRLLTAEKLYSLGIEFLEKPESNNLITRSRENFNRMEMVLEIISTFIGLVFTVVASGIIVFNFSYVVGIILIAISIPRFIFNRSMIKKEWLLERETTIQNRMSDGNMNYLITSAALKEVLALDAFKLLSKPYKDFSQNFIALSMKNRKRWYFGIYVMRFFEVPVFIYSFLLIVDKFVNGLITPGGGNVILNNLGVFTGSMGGIVNTFTDLSEATMRLKEIKQLLETEKEYRDGNVSLPEKDVFGIEFKNIDFKYSSSEKLIFNNFNLAIKPGEKIAIVGHNGAGKTTLIKLLNRIYRVTEGSIHINGNNINELKESSLNNAIGVLFQDYNTYEHLSVRDNIAIGNSDKPIDDSKIWEALEMADAKEFVQEYPRGLDTLLSEKYDGGVRPSTGQSQKIAIARFFYRDAPILILDEPTASIDAVAEANIFDRIYKFIENKTVIIISHRFSTVRNADRIIVLEKGKILEEGNHKELLAKDGTYAKAFNLQAKGYGE